MDNHGVGVGADCVCERRDGRLRKKDGVRKRRVQV